MLIEQKNFDILEQDACNVIFRDNFVKLPVKFNHIVPYAMMQGVNHIERHIYHFVSRSNYLDTSNIFSRLWFEYFVKTPFCSAETFGNLFDEIQNFMRTQNQIWLQLVKFSTRKRSFFVDPNHVNLVTNFFGASEGDIIINAATPNAFQNLIDLMQKSKQICFIFIAPNIFNQIKSQLESLGFKENEDFFNAYNLIVNHQRINDSYNFVKEM